ncbi:MAG: ornithine carbamoyltransferase [Candidatus Nitronauta litoralis]|uniref:Ornithine carbamoyltransferase n=1 Tax=Candidatus Nitronauta litoralis TaxID=2705533 RepID=A0A7T0BVM0_9BACT|nr:MAG: ornithine carbamoyltransferase [Candidatus Nitronauta litoralis]
MFSNGSVFNDMKKDFLSLGDFSSQELQDMLVTGLVMKDRPAEFHDALKGKTLGMIFNKRSTRTRISFQVGILQLGGYGLVLSPNDLQLSRGESIEDTARILSGYLDGVMIRTFAHEEIVEFARHATIPVINGLTDYNHPCQAMADMLTLLKYNSTLEGLKLAYLGDSNNVTVSLLFACVHFGMHMAIISPEGYTLDPSVMESVREQAEQKGLSITLTSDVEEGVAGADAVYTDTWTSMGQEDEAEKRLKDLDAYRVDARVMSLAKPGAFFMHCLPAHRGEEVSADVMDGGQSLVWEQAENRLHIQKSILYHLMK